MKQYIYRGQLTILGWTALTIDERRQLKVPLTTKDIPTKWHVRFKVNTKLAYKLLSNKSSAKEEDEIIYRTFEDSEGETTEDEEEDDSEEV